MEKKKKINLQNITFCIPIRIESPYRMHNLETLLKYLDQSFETNYIVLEADNKPHFKKTTDIQNLSYVFVKDEDIIFHRTKYINQMIHLAHTPHAAIWDTDAIAPVGQIEKAYTSLHNGENTIIYPFSGIFIALNELVSLHFHKSLDINYISLSHLPCSFFYGFYSVGGAYMINIDKYLKAGGENEYFYGWGPEDAERNARIQILEFGVERIEGVLYHLYHTRGINSRDSNQDNVTNNKKEFCKICGMSKLELCEYIKTWKWNKRI
ncbi:galactosyltransferase-related protein [Bacteroides oleiciplenus]|uniref:galactosyltransferase-related protein n=1 Tax=Bacteroides oleiciplenus TaxID=626931 RepID=UPI0026DD081B|nr:galactosyltransferase-related protein [Bacteroides oleiciplenus]